MRSLRRFGERNQKGQDAWDPALSDELWKAAERCWLEDHDAQPGVEKILSCLNDTVAFWYMGEFQLAMREQCMCGEDANIYSWFSNSVSLVTSASGTYASKQHALIGFHWYPLRAHWKGRGVPTNSDFR